MRRRWYVRMAAAIAVSSSAAAAAAQEKPAAPTATIAAPAQIDQTIVNLPTTQPLKRHGSYFRLTHRFARDLRRGTLGDLTSDLFGLDNGSIIGLEYRFGLTPNLQAGVHRSIFNKTIVLLGRWDAWSQGASRPIGLSVGASFEGDNNLRQDYQPSAAVTVSRTHGNRIAAYATPTFVYDAHTHTLLELHEGHEHDLPGGGFDSGRHTFFLGLGARLRLLETTYLVGEASPRLAGYSPDRAAWNVGIEKTTHGHVLQINFGNNFDTTPGQIARGGDRHAIYLGFNISRRFY